MSETLSDEELNDVPRWGVKIGSFGGEEVVTMAHQNAGDWITYRDYQALASELLAARKKLAELEADGRFLIDQLTDFYWGDLSEEAYREFAGHVVPAMERIRAALPSIPKGD